MKTLAALLLQLLLVSAAFAETPPIVTEALKALDADNDGWAYLRTTVEKDGRQIDRYDPSRPEAERWTLIEKNGKAPTAREQAAFRKERAKFDERGAEKKEAKERDGATAMIRKGSLKLVREDATHVVYTFLPPDDGELGPGFDDAVLGTLTIGKGRPHAFVLELKNTQPIKPITSVHIERFRLAMDFRPITTGGPVLPYRIEASAKGRALFVKAIDQETVTTYSEYRNVGNPR